MWTRFWTLPIQDFEKQLDKTEKVLLIVITVNKNLQGATTEYEENCESCEKVGFSPVWEKIISTLGQPPLSRKITVDQVDKALDPRERYRKLYHTIIDKLTGHLTGRFLSLEPLQFFYLLNQRKQRLFPDETLPSNVG